LLDGRERELSRIGQLADRPRVEEALGLHRAGGRPFDQSRTEFGYGEHLRGALDAGSPREPTLHSFEDLKAAPVG
jgi:hypothetical protein